MPTYIQAVIQSQADRMGRNKALCLVFFLLLLIGICFSLSSQDLNKDTDGDGLRDHVDDFDDDNDGVPDVEDDDDDGDGILDREDQDWFEHDEM
ncbi:uncharacterized protein LOC111696839 [Eurytemora carolleeae]|uniref:uncharacterized protein LOC111696839 n=1 Tax=Eurytemora carolleeae TaxID=1294199 RepID=UPI000C76AB75|nr:uncharacterized protein LOC111696839 [Eurytemora carolleeae]|eukprot:XP_023322355.1 uncharacterized protein LOC111696839 [Eurytemora affinis]